MDKVPLDRLAQQWYGNGAGVRLSGFSTLFKQREVTKIAGPDDGRLPKQVYGASSYDVLASTGAGSCHHLMLNMVMSSHNESY